MVGSDANGGEGDMFREGTNGGFAGFGYYGFFVGVV